MKRSVIPWLLLLVGGSIAMYRILGKKVQQKLETSTSINQAAAAQLDQLNSAQHRQKTSSVSQPSSSVRQQQSISRRRSRSRRRGIFGSTRRRLSSLARRRRSRSDIKTRKGTETARVAGFIPVRSETYYDA